MTDSIRRVALVTGCGKPNGIGNAIARALAKTGVTVVVSDVRGATAEAPATGELNRNRAPEGLGALVAEIEASGGAADWNFVDVRSESDTQRVVAETVRKYGRLDIIVNNAAAPQGADRNEVDVIPIEAWDEVMDINARGVFLMAKAALPTMRENAWGRIINISSAVVNQPLKTRAVYTASKAAIVGFTRALAMDVASQGITVNAVCPGSILTSRALGTATRSSFSDPNDALASTAKTIPAGRHGVPEDVAAAAVFFASEHSSYVTGQTLTVDGGGVPTYK